VGTDDRLHGWTGGVGQFDLLGVEESVERTGGWEVFSEDSNESFAHIGLDVLTIGGVEPNDVS
jgi:hypothetical protein